MDLSGGGVLNVEGEGAVVVGLFGCVEGGATEVVTVGGIGRTVAPD